ncbi:Neuroblastoma-amplified sequence [Halotydeus destructor]|nr:Neuroblastoma-amplified sequence [Halotydeus destructor]
MLDFREFRDTILQYLVFYLPFLSRFQAIEDVRDETDQKIELRIATPEEIFGEKILNELYDEALEVARKYGLDADRVYQVQWSRSTVNSKSIQEYLSKVEDVDWVIHECTNRVADTPESQKQLLEYGLKYTALDSILNMAVSEPVDDGEDEERSSSLGVKRKEKSLSEKLDGDQTSLAQKQRIISRFKMLRYLDKLETFKRITSQSGRYDANSYDRFRNESAFASALSYARASNHSAVHLLLTHEGREALENWIAILSNFPEVLSPFEYRNILPECSVTEDEVFPWEEMPRREDDWCEKYCTSYCNVLDWHDFDRQFYDSHPSLRKYKTGSLKKSLLTTWYTERALQIEEFTSLVAYSLELIKLGIERNVSGLGKLHDELGTLATIVYDCLPRSPRSNSIKFSQFVNMSRNEVISFLMLGSGSNEKTFIKSVKQFLIPYLRLCDTYNEQSQFEELLTEYLVSIGKNDLSLCRAVFEESIKKEEGKDENEDTEYEPIIKDERFLLELSVRVIYANEEIDQLDEAFRIVECLPQRKEDNSPEISKLQDDVDLLEKHLAVAEQLEKFGCSTSIRKLKYLQFDAKLSEVKLLFERITKMAPKRDMSKVFKERDWAQLLSDMHLIHKDCFEHVFPRSVINEIAVKTLLSTNKREDIALASKFMSQLSTEDQARVVLEAAQNHLNAASSVSDELIQLAKECLLLITSKDKETRDKVEEELDFIAALAMLDNDFDFKMLPVQMRLMEQPRLDLLTKILKSTNGSYKKVGKVLKIADLLRICSDKSQKEKESLVLSAMAGDALTVKDYSMSWLICQRIMNHELHSGWKICYRLGKCDQFRDSDAKLQLLAFSLTYCDDANGSLLSKILDDITSVRSSMMSEENDTMHDFKKLSQNVTKITEHVSKTAQQLSSWVMPVIPLPILSVSVKSSGNEPPASEIVNVNSENEWGQEWDEF